MQTACDLADVILGSAKDEICFFTGIDDDFSAAKSLQKGNNTVICKLGGQGCAVFTKDIALLQPAADVTVADTLGAGDTFSGGLLAGLSRGLELDNCLRMATAAAGYSVQFTGAGTVGDINTLQPIINTLAPCELI